MNTGVGGHFLLQGIFLILASNPSLLHYRQILYRLSYEGIPTRSCRPHLILRQTHGIKVGLCQNTCVSPTNTSGTEANTTHIGLNCQVAPVTAAVTGYHHVAFPGLKFDLSGLNQYNHGTLVNLTSLRSAHIYTPPWKGRSNLVGNGNTTSWDKTIFPSLFQKEEKTLIKSMTQKPDSWVRIPALPVTSYVAPDAWPSCWISWLKSNHPHSFILCSELYIHCVLAQKSTQYILTILLSLLVFISALQKLMALPGSSFKKGAASTNSCLFPFLLLSA